MAHAINLNADAHYVEQPHRALGRRRLARVDANAAENLVEHGVARGHECAREDILERAVGDEAFLHDKEAVSPERFDLIGRERVDQDRGRVFSGS